MLRQKFKKRILPVILSVSMVLGLMPSSVFAAEYEDGATEEQIIVEERTESGLESTDMQEITYANEDSDDAQVSSEMGTEMEPELSIADTEAEAKTEIETEIKTEMESKEDAVEENEQTQAAFDTRIVIHTEKLQSYIAEKTNTLQYDIDKDVILAKYEESDKSVFAAVKSELQDNTNGYRIISIEVDGKEITSGIDKNNIRYQWKEKSGNTYTDMTDEPQQAGDYKLVISLQAVDGVCQAAAAELDFTITKRQIFIGLENAISVAPGTTVSDFINDLKENYVLYQESRRWNGQTSMLSEEAKSVYIASIEAEVYDAHDAAGAALSNDTVLKENCDYTVSVKASLNDAASPSNVIVDAGPVNIKMQNLVETKVKIRKKNVMEDISKVYQEDKPIQYDTDIKDRITVSIVVPNQDGDESKDTVIEGAQPTLVWYDADKNELEADKDVSQSDEAPVDAGIYYLDFQYIPTGDAQNIYQESKGNYLKIVIEPAPLTLKPFLPEDGQYYTGMTAKDVLKDADYALFHATGEEFAIDKETFWGVSYNNPDQTQAYEPVFQIVKAEKKNDGDKTWIPLASEEALDASKFSYRIVFTGKKAVYTADGTTTKNETWDVNGKEVNTAHKNYCIVTTKDALLENYADVPVLDGKAAEIDISEILAGCKASENMNDLYQPTHFASKVYDGGGLFENREAYKKAKVTGIDGSLLASGYDDALTYTWYKLTRTEDYDEETGKQTGWKEGKAYELEGNKIPSAAGDYKLVVRFSDFQNGYTPSSKTLYYRIDKQLLVVALADLPTAHEGETIGAYMERVRCGQKHSIYLVPNNEYSEGIKTEQNLLADWKLCSQNEWDNKGSYYDLIWHIEELGSSEDNTAGHYTQLTDNDCFTRLDENAYRLGVELVCNHDDQYANYEVIYHADKENQDFETEHKFYNDYKNITVKKIGDTAIELTIDETKLASREKNYDAEPFYASKEVMLSDVAGAIIVKERATGKLLEANALQEAFSYKIYDEETQSYIYPFDEMSGIMVNAGTYRIEISYPGDAVYAPCEAGQSIEYTVNPLTVKAEPSVYSNLSAGRTVARDGRNGGIIYDSTKTTFTCENMPEQDKAAFTYGTFPYQYIDENGEVQTGNARGFAAFFDDSLQKPAFHAIRGSVRKAGSSAVYSGCIRYNTDYTVQLSGEPVYPYSRNYKIEYVKIPFRATQRGAGAVSNISINLGGFTLTGVAWVTDFETEPSGTVTRSISVRAGISYVSNRTIQDKYGREIVLEGNYIPIRITAPEEFKEDTGNYSAYFDNFVYKNSIEKDAGGYIIRSNAKNGTIDIVLPVDKEKTPNGFEIIWENGYTQKYMIDVSNAILMDDLTKAVAPKSIAFNGVNTKMAVGEEQQLDVKLTKAQLGDVIYLDYKVTEGIDVVSVASDDDKKTAGYVTALKVGTATIEAVPVRLENGEKVRIPDAKTATVKITVSDVTAPAVKKITAIDNRADVTYVKPSDGYRREIYVLEGGKRTEEEFRAAIASMKNGNWQGIFASAPVYCVNETVTNEKTKLFTKQITGLKADTEYTVYVRNVSAVRTIYDDNQVAVSAKGVVKNFKTTAPQVQKLEAYFKQSAEGKADETAEQEEVSYKEIAFSQKKEQLYVSGLFAENALDEPEHASADDADLLRLELPLDKKNKKYVAPKLVYWLSPDETGVSREEISNVKAYIYAAERYYRKTKIASIDKKGMITFKGTGTIYAHVYDPATGLHDTAELYIYADADRVTGKGGKLAVGQGVWLSSLLTYYEGKTAIVGYHEQKLSISDEQLQKIGEDGAFRFTASDGDYYITAIKPNVECSFTVIDQLVAQKENSSSEVALSIQSKPIEPVKNMKITDIADDRFVVNFSYPISADRESALTGSYVLFRIDITDARGSAVASVILYTASPTAFQEYLDKDAFLAEIKGNACYYDEAKKVIHFRCPYLRTSGSGRLLRLSNYKVSVIPIYGMDYSAKPAVKTVKTTNCPASHESLGKTQYGGQDVTVIGCAGESTFQNSLSDRPYLTSGNTYTLRVNEEEFPKDRMTDTLTWKSTNTKTATVKANAGTYSATLKAVKSGTTVIEVTSKITKKVIARYPVFVKAVGNAKDDFYGDYEYKGEYVYELDPFYHAGIEVLTEANPVRVNRYDLPDLTVDGLQSQNYKWVKFMAPEFGDYTFTVDGTGNNAGITDIVSPEGEHETKNYATVLTKTIFQGQTYYFKVYDTFVMTVKGEKLRNVITETGVYEIDTEAAQYIQFIAMEDNVYTFWTQDVPDAVKSISDAQNQPIYADDILYDNGRWQVSLHAGDSIYLKMDADRYKLHIEKRNPETLTEHADLKLTDEVKEKWYCYTAAADGLYTVVSENATSVLEAAYYESILNIKATDVHPAENGNNFHTRYILKAGEKLLLRVSAEEAASAELKVIPELFEYLTPGEEKDTTVGAGSRRWIVFTLPEAGRYRLDVMCAEADEAYGVNLKYYRNDIDGDEITSITDGEITVSDKAYAHSDTAVGDTIYVEATTTKEGETPANVKVSLSRINAKELVLGEETALTVKNGTQQWYTFKVPKDGKYMVKSAVTQNVAADTHRLTAAWYQYGIEQKNYTNRFKQIGDYDIYYVRTFKAGDIVTFQVSADDLTAGVDGAGITTEAKIIAKEFSAEPFTIEQPADITVLKNEEQWYSFTAPETKAYMFQYRVTEGKLDSDYHRKFDDFHHVYLHPVMELDMEAGQTVWFHIEAESGTAKCTISVTPMEKISGTVEKTAVVTKDAPLYYKYTSNEDYRYDIGYTINTEGAKAVCAVSSLIEEIDSAGSAETIAGYRVFEKDSTFLKVSTESETPVSVTFYVKPIETVNLKVGTTDKLTLAPRVEPRFFGRYTWCSFTAEEPGKYAIRVSGSGVERAYYGHIWDSNKQDALSIHTYEAGETIYVALFTTQQEQKTASVTVEKITSVPMSGSSVDETLEARKAKCYSYAVQKTGLYTFTGSSDESTDIRIYEDIDNDMYSSIQGNGSMTMFLTQNSTMLIRAWSDWDTTIRFSIELEGEAQTLSETGQNAIDFGEQDHKLLAFSPENTGYYDFDIAYSGTDVGATGSAYYMNSSQPIPKKAADDSVIYSSSSGDAGTVAFHDRLVLQGETVYLYIPKPNSAEGANVVVSKKDVQVEAVMLTEGKQEVRMFGDGDEVIYVFHVPDALPTTGGYVLTFERADEQGSFTVDYDRTGLNEPSWRRFGTLSDINTEWNLYDTKMHQRVCYKVTKKGGNSDERLTITVARGN